jgi:hypothetical protein
VATQKAAEDAEKAKAEGKTPQSAEIVAKRIDGSVAEVPEGSQRCSTRLS